MNIFLYDKTFEGLLTFVFEAYSRRIFPDALLLEGEPLPLFYDEIFTVITDEEKSGRVWRGLQKKLSSAALACLAQCWLAEEPETPMLLFRYIRKAIDAPRSIETNFVDCELVYCPIEDGTLGDAVTVSLRILSGTNTAPVCEDGTLETYKNIANTGTLSATDQEDQELTYQLVKEPKRGTVELHTDGSFTYTPDKNKVGKDSFVFTATDPAGNVSNEACVKIRILKPADKATYQDMSGDRDAFAAMWLKDKGLYTGRVIAGNLCFEPDCTVSRSEFLIACMKLAGLEQSDGTISTGFADELETPLWQQPYLAAAYQSGMISGTPTEEGLVFRPEEDLSRAEAAVMLQKLLRLPGDAAVFAPDEASAIPAWAQSAVSALSNAGIPLAASDYEAPLTRREAANMLLAAAPAAEAAGLYWSEQPNRACRVCGRPDAQPQKRQDARFLTVDFWALVCYSVTD